jgi:hypothetical protein
MARDEILCPAQAKAVSVRHGFGRDIVRIRAGIGLGDGEGHLLAARAQARQKRRALLGRAITSNDGPTDGGRHDQEEKGRADRG